MYAASILLFCSEPLVRTILTETLEANGYTVFPVGDLGSAVDRLREVKPDLLIIRTYVDRMPGHDAARYLRTKRPGMRVLMASGLLDDDRLNFRESIHGIEVFPKPFTATDLLEKVHEVLSTTAPSSGQQTQS
jgi:DNA-binding response OmpR family regulator